MHFDVTTGQFNSNQDAINMNVVAGTALAYGDICTITGTTQVSTGALLVVARSAADSIAVVGVCQEPGGLVVGQIGRMTTYGIADCNMVSAGYTTPGALVTTNGGGNGTGAIGTPAAGKVVGMTIGDVTGTVTQTKVFVMPNQR